MNHDDLKPGAVVRGPVFPEPIVILVVQKLGDSIKVVGAGQRTGQAHQRVLSLDQLALLEATPEKEPFDGDAERFHRANPASADLENRRVAGELISGLEGNIAQAETHLDELNGRLEHGRAGLAREMPLMIGDIDHLGRAWVLPHPDRTSPCLAPMVRDDEVERIAVEEAIRFEVSRGWGVDSVEKDTRGFDLISRKPDPHDDATLTGVRFIEVRGRAGTGDVALSSNEYKTAERLKQDSWLYVVFGRSSSPKLHGIQDPARLGWQPVVQVAHYHASAEAILEAAKGAGI